MKFVKKLRDGEYTIENNKACSLDNFHVRIHILFYVEILRTIKLVLVFFLSLMKGKVTENLF